MSPVSFYNNSFNSIFFLNEQHQRGIKLEHGAKFKPKSIRSSTRLYDVIYFSYQQIINGYFLQLVICVPTFFISVFFQSRIKYRVIYTTVEYIDFPHSMPEAMKKKCQKIISLRYTFLWEARKCFESRMNFRQLIITKKIFRLW